MTTNQATLVRIALGIVGCNQGRGIKIDVKDKTLFDSIYPNGSWKERSVQCLTDAISRQNYFAGNYKDGS